MPVDWKRRAEKLLSGGFHFVCEIRGYPPRVRGGFEGQGGSGGKLEEYRFATGKRTEEQYPVCAGYTLL